MNKRSVAEKQKLQREVRQYYKKWTFVYSSMIVAYTWAMFILFAIGFWYLTAGLIFGICFFIWQLSEAKGRYKHQLEIINKIVAEIKPQEVLEAELEELKAKEVKDE